MKNYNTNDFNPHGVPLPSNDFFSFLDSELYYIAVLENMQCTKFIKNNTDTGIMTFDSFSRSGFRFLWTGNGYHICSADNSMKVLTLHFSKETGSYYVSMEKNRNAADQLWDIVPYDGCRSGYGISIRSAVYYSGTYLYISVNSYRISVTKESANNTRLMLCSLSNDWITFGMACMQYLGWIYVTEQNVQRTIHNFFSNMLTGISPENKLLCGTTELFVFQAGGNFSRLHYADVFMNEVACEAIAVCNALRILYGFNDPSCSDLFRIAAEFELSGLYDDSLKKIIVSTGSALGIKKLSDIDVSEGSWGGDPDKIRFCLEAHGAKFTTVHIKNQPSIINKNKRAEIAASKFDDELKSAVCGIVSYNFSTLHQAIHTFACIPDDNNSLRAFNRYCNHTLNGNYLNNKAANNSKEIYSSCAEAVSQTKGARYYTGYLIYRA